MPRKDGETVDGEKLIYLILGIIAVGTLIFVLAKPLRFLFKLILNSVLGFAALTVVKLLGAFIGFVVPINLWTLLAAGILGLPGIILILVLQLLYG